MPVSGVGKRRISKVEEKRMYRGRGTAELSRNKSVEGEQEQSGAGVGVDAGVWGLERRG